MKIKKNKKYMISSNLPSILVPLTGLIFPAITMVFIFLQVEEEQLS